MLTKSISRLQLIGLKNFVLVNLMEPTPDLFQLIKDKEKRIKIKAMVLGELNEKSESN